MVLRRVVLRRVVVRRVVVSMVVALPLSHAAPAGAAPVVLTDGTQDVGDRRADITSLSVDQDGSVLAVGVRLLEFADPRTDFFWRDPRASSLVEVSVDRNGDNKADYLIDFFRVKSGRTSALAVQVTSTTSIVLRCNGSYSLDPKGGWIRVSVPKTCVPATAPCRVQAMYSFNRSAERPTLSPVVDFAPDYGRWHPSR